MLQAVDQRTGRLRATTDLTPDIRLFEIEPDGAFVPPPPGSHLDVRMRINDRPDLRSYSIVGPCADGLYRIAVKLLPYSRGGSAWMWSLAPGARLAFTGPHDTFPLAAGRPDYLLVAGGIGITPIYTMATALARTDTTLRLVYAARRACDLAFGDELREILGDRLTTITSEAGGRVNLAAGIAALAPHGELYVCGPIGMLEAAKHAWQASGRPPEKLRFETFGSSGRFATVPFTVRIPRLGLEIAVPENRTMLDSLEAAGVAMISDCRKGECGLCALPILAVDGVVDHRDVFFSDVEKAADAKLCTCVSRVAGGSITIDTADREG